MGDCKYCGKSAGFLRGKHRECDEVYKTGWLEMVERARQAAVDAEFQKAELHAELITIAERSWANCFDVDNAIAKGWRDAVFACLVDEMIAEDDETRLRSFSAYFALEDDPQNYEVLATLKVAVRNRYISVAALAALAGDGAEYDALEMTLRGSGLPPGEQRKVLIAGWEAAVRKTLDDRVPSLVEQATLLEYLSRFNLSHSEVNDNHASLRLVQAGVMRDLPKGDLPQVFTREQFLPINLQKSEEPVWLFYDVSYYEMRTRKERRRGEHYDSVIIEEEELHEEHRVDEGVLGITNKNIYFNGRYEKFRIPYEKIMSFDQYRDGFGLMRDARAAKPQIFRTGDGWFVYNLVVNLARL
ncbi:MAG: hypothetical protein OXN15_05690 [Chloroflexota bacterium]|nr:hypothetical protein [Chloroflexota bacterium]MDE2969457.1 hypothetical protein [Chloroflexota bacterium]